MYILSIKNSKDALLINEEVWNLCEEELEQKTIPSVIRNESIVFQAFFVLYFRKHSTFFRFSRSPKTCLTHFLVYHCLYWVT